MATTQMIKMIDLSDPPAHLPGFFLFPPVDLSLRVFRLRLRLEDPC